MKFPPLALTELMTDVIKENYIFIIFIIGFGSISKRRFDNTV